MKTFKIFLRNVFLPYFIFLSQKDYKIKAIDVTMTRIRVMDVILFELEKTSWGRVLCKSLGGGGGGGAAGTMKTLTLY